MNLFVSRLLLAFIVYALYVVGTMDRNDWIK